VVDFKLYLISDRNQCADRSFIKTIGQACAAGVRCLQIREKDLSPKAVFEFVCEIQKNLAGHQPAILVNDRIDIALATDIDGVHLPETGLPVDIARSSLPTGKLLGVSAHSLDRAIEAEALGADFITFGPVFHTPSKESYGDPVGLSALKRVTSQTNIPVFALGGVKPENTTECLDAGAHGVAVISAILAAPDTRLAVARFETALGQL